MARYTVDHAYLARRDGQQFGPWEPGIEVELPEEDAEWVNRDSPGSLRPAGAPAAAAEPPSDPDPTPDPEPAPVVEAQDHPALRPNRQHKPRKTR